MHNIARIKKYKSIIKKKRKKHVEIALLAKTSLDCIKNSTSSSLTDSYIERKYFLLIDVLREYDGMKEKVNKLKLHKSIKAIKRVIVLSKEQKKYRKWKPKSCKDKKE